MAKKKSTPRESTTRKSTPVLKLFEELTPVTVDWGDGPHDMWAQILFHLNKAIPVARFLWYCVSCGADDFMRECKKAPHIFVWTDDPEGEYLGLLCHMGPDFQVRWLVQNRVDMDLWPTHAREVFYRAMNNEGLTKKAD